MKNKRVHVSYRVTSGFVNNYNTWLPCKTLAQARKEKRNLEKMNPHQGSGYRIIKVTSTHTEIK